MIAGNSITSVRDAERRGKNGRKERGVGFKIPWIFLPFHIGMWCIFLLVKTLVWYVMLWIKNLGICNNCSFQQGVLSFNVAVFGPFIYNVVQAGALKWSWSTFGKIKHLNDKLIKTKGQVNWNVKTTRT